MSKLRLFLFTLLPLAALSFWASIALADAPADPSADPQGAFSQFWQAVAGKKYGLAAVIGTMLFVAFVRFIAPRIHGPLGDFIHRTRVSAGLALVGGMASAIAGKLMLGTPWSTNIIVYGFGIGVAAIGGYNAFWDLLFPNDTKKSTGSASPAAMLLPIVFLFGITATGCGTCDTTAKTPTCARKILTGIDALDGAAARISNRWLKSCGDDARALKSAGKLAEADVAYTRCEAIGGKLVASTKGVMDGTQTASDAVDAAEAAGQKEYGSILQPVWAFIDDLRKTFADAGLTGLPALPLGGN